MKKIFSKLKAKEIEKMKSLTVMFGMSAEVTAQDIKTVEWAHEENWWFKMPDHMKAIFCLSAGMSTINKSQMQSLENFSAEQRNELRESVEILMIEAASFLMKDVEGNQ